MIEVFDTVAGLREALRARRAGGREVAFVPTMGALHAGHLSLMAQGRARAEVLVASVFVNPTQFNNAEDLKTYPRDLERDVALCAEAGVDVVFAPSAAQMYPGGAMTKVTVSTMTDGLCGATRPGHFEGVTTIVAKLFNVVQPDVAIFGQKDYQQLAVIRQMVRDLDFPVEILAGATVREPDGLAMSSRNTRLGAAARAQAPSIWRALQAAAQAVDSGERDVGALVAVARGIVEGASMARIDYVEVVHPRTLEPMSRVGGEGVVMALAVFFGDTRLIDNMHLGPKPGAQGGGA